jgi:hypothetical protein
LTDKVENEKDGKHFFDVERFRKIHAETSRKRGRFSKALGRITGVFDTFQGAFAIMLGPLITFGMVFVIIYSLSFGALAFLGSMAIMIGGLTLFVDKKYGSSLQFADSSFWKKTLGQVIGGALAVGIFALLFFLIKSPPLHFP